MRTYRKTPARSRKRPRADPAKTKPYEESLVRKAAAGNTLLILPPDLTWGVIALALVVYMRTARKPAMILAPSRRMAERYQEFLTGAANIAMTALVTGRVPVKKRENKWNGVEVVCATPDALLVDLREGTVSTDQFGLVVVVEAHRAVGRHAHAEAARRLSGDARILAVTDDLPSNPGRAEEMLEALRITGVAGRSEYSPDVVACLRQAVKYVAVDLSPEISSIAGGLRRVFEDECAVLRGQGYGDLEDPTLARLYAICKAAKRGSGISAESARNACVMRRALDALEAHGLVALYAICRYYWERPNTRDLLERPQLVRVACAARLALKGGPGHPKTARLVDELAAEPVRALVVTGRDSSPLDVLRRLEAAGIPSVLLPTEAGMAGLVYEERTEAVGGFRAGRYRALVSVGVKDAYGGAEDSCLSRGDADLVVCCTGDPDTVKFALRSGAARVVVLVAKGSCEDPDAWAAAQLDWRTARVVEENRRKEGNPDAP